MNNKTKKELEEIEIKLLLEGIFQQYGYDFRDYAFSSLKRRILKSVEDEKLKSISGFQEKILHEIECMNCFLDTMSISVTEMFRDPGFYFSFRKIFAQKLKGNPHIKIWHAGCSTGEEVYSMAILLLEEGLLKKTLLYGTDINEKAVNSAKDGIYRLKEMQGWTNNYLASGGTESFSNYYSAKYDNAIMKQELKNRIVWSVHNLVTDKSFNEFDIIVIRNVMIYFNDALQAHVHNLIYESLMINGFLILGSKENLKFSPFESCYNEIDGKWKIYQKIK